MIQEYRTLLIKDLCARLPYNVKCEAIDRGIKVIGTLNGYTPLTDGSKLFGLSNKEYDAPDKYWQPKAQFSVEEIKSYLRPLSSITDEEEKEVEKMWGWHYDRQANAIFNEDINNPDDYGGYHLFFVCEEDAEQLIDWLNEHHFDYRGLIGKGLALEASKGMYNV